MSLPLSHAGGSVDGISATLDLKFASSKSLTSSSGITPSFSRASTGSYFNSSGVLTSAAINGPRFDHVYDGSSWISKGLLVEEQRTNYAKYANDLSTNWTNESGATREYNSIVSPDGTTNATKVNVAAIGYSGLYQYPLSNGGLAKYTYSVFAKKGTKDWLWSLNPSGSGPGTFFNLSNGTIGNVHPDFSASIVDCGNGWFRCVMVTLSNFSPTTFQFGFSDANNSVTPSSTGYSYVYGAQIELGSFATSFIPNNTAGSVTRSADVCQITGTDFSGFWNASEGSVAVEFDQLADASKMTNESYIYGFQNAADTEQFILRGQASGVYYWRSVNSGNVDATAQISSLGTATVKHASGYKLNDFASTFNGAAVVTDSSGTTPVPTALGIGYNWPSSGNRLNGHIARLRYFNKRLSNQQLEDLCKPEQQLKLDLNFSSSLSLTPTVGPTPSFSRASTGTYFNSAGVLTSAAINAPRFDYAYNGTSWVSKGLLVEEQRTNLALYSSDYTNGWTRRGMTQVAGQSSPDGGTNATLSYPSGSLSYCDMYRVLGVSATIGQAYTLSFIVKASGKNFAYISDINAGNVSYFNLNTGTVSFTYSGHNPSIFSLGGGWYRCSNTTTAVGTTGHSYMGISDSSGATTATVNGTDGAFVFAAQVETGSFSTSYIPTTTAAVTRSADVCQITGTDFSGMWNLSAGSIVVDGDSAMDASVTGGAYELWSIHGTPTIEYYYRGSSGFLVVDNSVRKNVIAIPAANTRLNTAIAFAASDFAASVNGAAVTTSANMTMPVTPTVLGVGNYSTAGGFQVNGHIARLRYYAIRLPNRLLIAKST